MRIDHSRVPILPEGKLLCEHYQLDPLGCISSGSLLVVAPPGSAEAILAAYKERKIVAAEIGCMVTPDRGKTMLVDGKEIELPVFSQDEVVKIF